MTSKLVFSQIFFKQNGKEFFFYIQKNGDKIWVLISCLRIEKFYQLNI